MLAPIFVFRGVSLIIHPYRKSNARDDGPFMYLHFSFFSPSQARAYGDFQW